MKWPYFEDNIKPNYSASTLSCGILEKTVKCPICGEPYKFMAFYSGDQSACPKCRQKAGENMGWMERI